MDIHIENDGSTNQREFDTANYIEGIFVKF